MPHLKLISSKPVGSGCFLCDVRFPIRFWAFPLIADVLRKQSHGVGRALLGMGPRPPREVRNPLFRRRSSNECPLAKISWQKSDVAPNAKIGLFRTRNSFSLFFVGLCTVVKTSNYASGEAGF